MIAGLNEQLQQELEYTLIVTAGDFKNAIWKLEERYAIKFYFKLRKNAMLWKLDLLLWPWDQKTEFPVEAGWLSQTQEG